MFLNMQLTNIHQLFIHKLNKLYDAEQQLIVALPRLADAVANEDLRKGFEKHLEQTQEHAKRLEQIAGKLNIELGGQPHVAIEAIIEEAELIMEEVDNPTVKDLALIGGARNVEHLEISGYTTAIVLAKSMEHDDAERELEETLKEEEETEKELSILAEKIGKEGAKEMDGENME
jgi:ferritin-like metal-binding protein YciE